MNISATKIELAKQLLKTDSIIILKHVEAVLKSYKTDLWDELSHFQKQSVKRAKGQLEKGFGMDHELVIKKYKRF
jgi:carbamate kinase